MSHERTTQPQPLNSSDPIETGKFPQQLREIADDKDSPDICWQPGGDGITVQDEEKVYARWKSFRRTMNAWGFKKGISRRSKNTSEAATLDEKFCWHHEHELFTKEDAENGYKLQRDIRNKATRRRKDNKEAKADIQFPVEIHDASSRTDQKSKATSRESSLPENSDEEVFRISIGSCSKSTTTMEEHCDCRGQERKSPKHPPATREKMREPSDSFAPCQQAKSDSTTRTDTLSSDSETSSSQKLLYSTETVAQPFKHDPKFEQRVHGQEMSVGFGANTFFAVATIPRLLASNRSTLSPTSKPREAHAGHLKSQGARMDSPSCTDLDVSDGGVGLVAAHNANQDNEVSHYRQEKQTPLRASQIPRIKRRRMREEEEDAISFHSMPGHEGEYITPEVIWNSLGGRSRSSSGQDLDEDLMDSRFDQHEGVTTIDSQSDMATSPPGRHHLDGGYDADMVNRFWTCVESFLHSRSLYANCSSEKLRDLTNTVEDLDFLLRISRFSLTPTSAARTSCNSNTFVVHTFVWQEFDRKLTPPNDDHLTHEQIYWLKKKLQDLLSSHFAEVKREMQLGDSKAGMAAIEALSNQLEGLQKISTIRRRKQQHQQQLNVPDSDDDKDDDDGDDTADNSGNASGGSDDEIDDSGDGSGDDEEVFGGGAWGPDDLHNGHSGIDFDVDLAKSTTSGLRGTVPYENTLLHRNDAPSVDVETKRGTELKANPAPNRAEAGTTFASRDSSCAVSQIAAEDCACLSGDNQCHNDATAAAEYVYEYCDDEDKRHHNEDGDDESCAGKFTASENEEDAVHVVFATLTIEEETTRNGDFVSVTASRQPDLGLHSAGHTPDGASGEPIDEDSDDCVGESVDKDGDDNNEDDCDYDDENEGDDSGNLGWSKKASGTGVVRNPTFHHTPPREATSKHSTEGNDADDGNNDSDKRCGDSDDDDHDDVDDDDNYDDKDDDNNKHVMTATAAAKLGDDATSSRNVLHDKEDAKVTNGEDDKDQDRGGDSSFSSRVSVSSRDMTAASGGIENDNEDGSVRDLTEAFASTVEKKMSASSHDAMQSSDNASVSHDYEGNDDLMEKMGAFQLDEEDQFDSMSEMEFEDFPDISPRADSRGMDRYRRASPWSSLKKYVGGKVWRNRSGQTGDSSSVVTGTTATNTVTTGTLSLQGSLPPFAKVLLQISGAESWNAKLIRSMSTSRSHFAAVMHREEGKIVLMGGWGEKGRAISSVESIFPPPIEGGWPRLARRQTHTMPPLTRPRRSFGAAILTTRLATTTATLVPSSINGNDYPPPQHQCRHIVVAGGLIDKSRTESAEVFNLSTNQWTDLPPLQVKRYGCAVTSLYSSNIVRGDDGNEEDCGGRVYVVGGGGVCYDTVEWLDVSAALQGGNSEPAGWRYLPSRMKRGRAGCAAVMVEWSEGGVVSGSKSNAVEGDGDASLWGVQLVVVGGETEESITDTVECFDFGRGQWRDLPRMTTRRVECAAVAIGRRIFVVGGMDANSNPFATAEYFDFGTHCWTRLAATMSGPRWGCAAVVMTDKGNDNPDIDGDNGDNVCHRLVVLGGLDWIRSKALSSVEVLEIREADAAKQAAITSPTTFRPATTSPPIDSF